MAEALRGEFQLLSEPIEISALDTSGELDRDYFELEEGAINEMVDDARWIFSGMIYGYEVAWIPPFRARAVEEKFEIELVAQISAGDERLKTFSIDRIDGMIYVLMEYASDFTQDKRLEAWRISPFPYASGEGRAPISGGSRREALEMAIKEAIKKHFVGREFNRPKSIQTRVALVDFPQIGFNNGEYRALVGIRIGLNSVLHYKID